MNIIIGLLVDGEYAGECELAGKPLCIFPKIWLQTNFVLELWMNCVLLSFPEIDVQLVGVVKVLIDPENIMIETAAVSVQQLHAWASVLVSWSVTPVSTAYEAWYVSYTMINCV